MAVFRSELSHYRNILATMNDLRKQKSPCDVRIKVGSQEIRVQRCVLMAAIDYPSSMLADINCEVELSSIDISSTTQDVYAVESVINYLYSGEIRIDNDSLEPIIKVALLFCREDIKDFCCKFMLDNLDWKTSMEYNQFALEYGFPTVQQQSAEIVKSRFHPSLFSDKSFQNIRPKELKFLVSSCDIFDNCGVIQIFEFLSAWVRTGKSKEHEQVGCDILKYIIPMTGACGIDSFAEIKLNESSFEETFENVVLLLNRKLTKGINDKACTSGVKYVKDYNKPSMSQLNTSLQHTEDPEFCSGSQNEWDHSGFDQAVVTDALVTESTVISSDAFHQISIDMDNVVINSEDNVRGKCIAKSNKRLKDMKETHMAYSCQKCHKSFQKHCQLNIHKKIHNKKGSFKCVACKKKFTLKKYLKTHMNVHSTDKKFACSFCDKCFKWKESLVKHMVVHTGSTKHVCSHCNKPFSRLSLLNIHMLKHSEAKLSCEVCGRKYKYKSDLKHHVENHKKDTVFTCYTCGLKFEKCQQLKAHIKLHTGEETSIDHVNLQDANYHIQTDPLVNNNWTQLPVEQTVTSKDNKHLGLQEQKQTPHCTAVTENSLVPAAKADQHENKCYTCKICFKTFHKRQNLNLHVKLHTTARPFDCVLCKKTFKTKRYLKSHMECHSNERSYSCEICEANFKRKESLALHMLHHRGIRKHVCKICQKSYTVSSSLKVHMLKHSAERNHVCKICRKMYKHKRDLEAHEETHTKDSVFNCYTCGLCFATQQAIQEHVKLHEGANDPLGQIKTEIESLQIKTDKENVEAVNTVLETDTISVNNENKDAHISENVKEENACSDTISHGLKQEKERKRDANYKCGICDKQIKSQHLLKIHLMTHSTVTPYDCVICKRKFKLKHYLKRHMRRHHCDVPDVCYKCSICQRQFREKQHLTTHMLYHEGIKRHFCSVCNKGFIVKGALTTHMKTHDKREKTLPCQICFKHFTSNTGLKNHMVSHMDPDPKTSTCICEVCGLEYKNESSLRNHKREAHSKTPMVFECELCNKIFTRKGSLTKHKTIHSDIKPYICATCGKQFRSHSTLTCHMLIHSDEKPHSCSECLRQFRDRSSLLRHSRIHTGEKSHYCKLCEKYFTRAENLRGHISRFHK